MTYPGIHGTVPPRRIRSRSMIRREVGDVTSLMIIYVWLVPNRVFPAKAIAPIAGRPDRRTRCGIHGIRIHPRHMFRDSAGPS